jgi:putative ABC transport system permease protein
VALGALHAILLALLIRLPIPAPLVRLAQRNVRHRPVRAIFAAVALFVGVFSIGFAGSALFTARDRVASRRGTVEGVNLVSYLPLERETAAIEAMRAAGAVELDAMISVAVRAAFGPDGQAIRVRSLVGRDPARIPLLEGGTILLPASRNGTAAARLGDVITVEGSGGKLALRVAGIFEPPAGGVEGFFDLTGPVVDRATALTLAGGQGSVVVKSHVPAESLDAASEHVGRALPEALVVSRADVNALLVRAYEGLFAFAAGIAALALLAGAVLVANAVGLGLLERRKELGILKAIGWTRVRVLGSVLLENGLLGALAGITGMTGVAVAIAFVNAKQPAAGLALRPIQGLVLASIAVLLALGAAALVAWRPTAARPLVVLREE